MRQYNVNGMSCAACSARVEKAVLGVKGVTACSVSLLTNSMGVEGTDAMSIEDARKAAIDAVKKLSADVGIPADLKEIVKEEDIDFLAQSAFDDACRPGNPRETSVEEIKELYLKLM